MSFAEHACADNTERSATSLNASCEYQDGLGKIFCDQCDLSTRGTNLTCLNCEETSKGLRVRGVSICDCRCRKHFYHRMGLAGADCLPCPDGADCDGEAALPIPKKGFWGDREYRLEMYACDVPDVCLGGSNFSCADMHTGTFCADCMSGYYKVAETCWPCRYRSIAIAVLIFMFILWRGINSVVAARVETVELMLNFVQLANIIGDLPLEWPNSLVKVFGVASALDFDVDVVEPTCFVSWSFGRNFYVQLGLPVLLSLLALVWFCFGMLRYSTSRWYRNGHNWFARCFRAATLHQWEVSRTRFHGDDFPTVEFDKLVAQIVAALEITYLTTTKYCLDVFRCQDVAGVSVMSESPDTICGSDEHNRLRAFAVFGLFLYTGGYLAFVVLKLAAMQRTRSFMAARNVRRYGFIYERFELDYTWAAILTLIVRILYVVLRVLVNNPLAAVGGIAIVTMAWLFIHIYTLPYVKDQLDLLQSFFLVCLLTFAMSGLLFSCDSVPRAAQDILERGVMAIVAAMFITTMFFFTIEILQKFRIWVIKKRHRKAVSRAVAKGQHLAHNGDAMDHDNMELYSTVDPTFLYRWLRVADTEKLLQFDRLSEVLGRHLCDDAPCSYLSLEMTAKFWRDLALAFPELIDFLAMAKEEDRSQFLHLMETLYRNFFLTKHIGEDNLWSHIDWKDRGALMQWLAVASTDDRRLFGNMIADGVRHTSSNDAAERLARKLEQHPNGRYAPEADASESRREGVLQRVLSSAYSSSAAREEISAGRGPLTLSRTEYSRVGSKGEELIEELDNFVRGDEVLDDVDGSMEAADGSPKAGCDNGGRAVLRQYSGYARPTRGGSVNGRHSGRASGSSQGS